MYLLPKFGCHRSYGNGDINSYMNTSESWTHCIDFQYWEILKIRNTDWQFQSSGHGWQKNEKNTSNYNRCAIHVNAARNRWLLTRLRFKPINSIRGNQNQETTSSKGRMTLRVAASRSNSPPWKGLVTIGIVINQI